MKSSDGYEQAYNVQAAVEMRSRLIVGERVSQAPNDSQELVPRLATVVAEVGPMAAALADDSSPSG